MRIITVHHHKGGVGKSTTVQYLAHNLTRRGHRVLVVDGDAQGNQTAAWGEVPGVGLAEAYRAEMESGNAEQFVRKLAQGPSLLAGGPSLQIVQEEIANFRGTRVGLLAGILQRFRLSFDYTIIDTPPAAGWLVFNALFAADVILAPVQCEAFAIQGIAGLQSTLEQIGRETRTRLGLTWIVPTFVDGRRREHGDYLAALREAYGAIVTATAIRTDAGVPRAQTTASLSERGRAASDYAALVAEIAA